MTAVVVPFRESDGKTRLGLGRAFALAMLADVLEAANPLGTTVIAGAAGGQGAAVAAELDRLGRQQILIVNADLPCATPHDLLALLGSAPLGGIALVEAADGTTNALALSAPAQFRDVYGPGSAARFRAHAESLGVSCVTVTIPNLADDVDTLDDLQRLEGRLGRHTAGALASLRDVA
jgi:2-phospho-L-lactate guanylyltransferase (CobY/MobA/RfbA family)